MDEYQPNYRRPSTKLIIIKALQQNNTLQWLQLPYYPSGARERIRSSAEEIIAKRKSRECRVKLEIYCGRYEVAS